MSLRMFLAPALAAALRAPIAADPPPDLDLRVDEAIDAGVEHLLVEVEGREGWTPGKKYPAGYTALQVYALVKSDVSFQHPVVQKGIAAMERFRLAKVYPVSLTIMACGAILDQIDADMKLGGSRLAGERARFLERMAAALSWLIQARLQGMGSWNYEPVPAKASPRTHRWDNSNTQFAVLALGVAAEHGLKVPKEVWEEVADHFIRTQEAEGEEVAGRPVFKAPPDAAAEKEGKDGAAKRPPALGKTTARKAPPLQGGETGVVRARGWRYTREEFDPPKFSMTCAGLSSVLLAQHHLGGAAAGGDRAEALRRSIRDGCGWVTRFFAAPRPLRRVYGVYYDLYSLEKVGDLGEVEAFGDFRWYEECADQIVRAQREDGGWGPRDEDAVSRHSTALALLFLSRATDLGGRARPLWRVTSAAGRGGPGRPAAAASGWIYLPSQKAEVPLARLLRLFRYRPVKGIAKLVEEAVKVQDPMALHELVREIADSLEKTPYPAVKDQARKLLAQATGVEYEETKRYLEWAGRHGEAVRIGKAKESKEIERLREWLRTSDGTPLKARVIWALERTGGRAALGELIDLLEAADPPLREAAHSAVAFLSGQSLPFHPLGSERARAEEVRAWREWHAREGAAAGRGER